MMLRISGGAATLTLELVHEKSNGAMRFRRDKETSFEEAGIVGFLEVCLSEIVGFAIEENRLSRYLLEQAKQRQITNNTSNHMNLNTAIIEMSKGHKVKLPEWTGYWFIPNHTSHMVDALGVDSVKGKIKVFTKNGDILDSPWIDKYKDRDDFEIAAGKLGFDFAILALKNGKKVYRKGWNGKGMWIKMVNRGCFDVGVSIVEGADLTPFFGIKTAQGTFELGWKPTTPDMLAEDWDIINDTSDKVNGQ